MTDGASDTVTDSRVEPGENGACALAKEIAIGTSLTNEMIDATDDVSALAICPTGPDVVYRVTLTASADVSITALAAFNGMVSTSSDCPPMLSSQSSCHTMSANQSYQRTYTFAAGTTYIIVDKLSGNGSTFDIAVQ